MPTAEELLGPDPRALPTAESLLGPDPRGTAPAAAEPPPSDLPEPLRVAAGIGSAAARGLAYGLGMPGDLERLGTEYIANPISRRLGLQTDDPNNQANLLFPTSETMLGLTNSLGLTGHPSLAGRSTPERLAQGLVAGGAAALPAIALGQPWQAAMAGGATGGFTSQGAAELGAPEGIQLAAGVTAGLGATAAASLLGRNITHVARDLGTSHSLQEAGSYVQDSARTWLREEMPARLKSAWEPVDSLIPASTDTHLTNFQSALGAINSSSGRLQPVSDALRSVLPKTLANRLAGTPAGSGAPLEWAEVQQLRSDLGDALTKPKIVQDIGAKNLERLYASLSEDMRVAARSISPDAETAFNSANTTSQGIYGFAEKTLGRLVRDVKEVAEDPRPEDVAARLLAGGRRGGTDISALRAELPGAADELAAAHLRLNPNAQAWARLAPEAQEALVPHAGDRQIIAATGRSPGEPGALLRTIETLTGGSIGEHVGELVGHYLAPGLHPLVAGSAGALVGASLPWLGLGARKLSTNPLTLAAPVAGAEAGSSAP